MKKVYISGPISLGGKASATVIEWNLQRFRDTASRLRQEGYEVLTPLNNGLDQANSAWTDHMRVDIAMVCQADGIYLLHGWETSKGACLEFFIASQLEIPIMFEEE